MMAMAMEAKKGINGARGSEGMWCRTSAAALMIMAVSMILLDAQVLTAGESLAIAISSGDTTTIDLSHTKNITGLKITDAKKYFVVENQAGISAVLDGLSVVTLDLVEAVF